LETRNRDGSSDSTRPVIRYAPAVTSKQVNPIIRHMGWGEPAVGPERRGPLRLRRSRHGTNGDHGDIFYTRSTNNGKTWSKPIKLNTDKDNRIQDAVDAFAFRDFGWQRHRLLV
jgi:Neuraminidase (sialidase)